MSAGTSHTIVQKHKMRKKVLITGAGGFVGSALMRLCAERWDIVPVVRKKSGLNDEVIIDFSNAEAASKIDRLPKVDVVVHLAAKVDFAAAKEELLAPNVLVAEALAQWAAKIKAHFVFASSVTVCGVKTNRITEKSVVIADTNYGESKFLAEEKIKGSKVKYAILRIGGIYGKNGPDHLGVNRTIRGAMAGEVPTQYGTGELKRNYIYVKDLAEIIYFCVEKKIEDTHLVAGAYVHSMKEMLETVSKCFLAGKALKIDPNGNGFDQVIEHSVHLPKGRSFEEAIADIKKCG